MLYWFGLQHEKPDKTDLVPHLIDDNSGAGTQVVAKDVKDDSLAGVVVRNKKGTFILRQKLQAVSADR